MTPFKNFNIRIALVFGFVLMALSPFTIISYLAIEEGYYGQVPWVTKTLAHGLELIQFPFLIVFAPIVDSLSGLGFYFLFLLLLLFDIVFLSICMERLVYIIRQVTNSRH